MYCFWLPIVHSLIFWWKGTDFPWGNYPLGIWSCLKIIYSQSFQSHEPIKTPLLKPVWAGILTLAMERVLFHILRGSTCFCYEWAPLISSVHFLTQCQGFFSTFTLPLSPKIHPLSPWVCVFVCVCLYLPTGPWFKNAYHLKDNGAGLFSQLISKNVLSACLKILILNFYISLSSKYCQWYVRACIKMIPYIFRTNIVDSAHPHVLVHFTLNM